MPLAKSLVRVYAMSEKGGYFLSVQQNGEQSQKLSIPMTSQEVYGLLIMLKAALPLIHNWF